MSFGFHVGPGGNPTGIGNYVSVLDAAGIPATIVAVDTTTGISDALQLIKAGSDVPHNLVYRVSRGDARFDVPDYSLSPYNAAVNYRDLILGVLPPEVKNNRHHVHIGIGNELDKSRSDWIGEWLVESATLWNREDFRVVGPNWSSGEPEISHWHTSGMSSWLSMCSDEPHWAKVGVHEYSLSLDYLVHQGYLVGRFTAIYDACDRIGIVNYPEIIVTEVGWTHNDVPDPSVATEHLNTVLDTWRYYPPAAIWYLGPGYEGIADRAQRLIEPVINLTLLRPPKERTNDTDIRKLLWEKAQNQAIPYNAGAALEKKLRNSGAYPTGGEHWQSVGKEIFAYQPGRMIEDHSPVMVYTKVPDWGNIEIIDSSMAEIVDPLDGLELGAPFRLPFAMTSRFNADRPYGKHEGVDYDILYQPPDSKEPVLSISGGQVVLSRLTDKPYGHYVVVESDFHGVTYRVWYAHMDARYVKEGDTVSMGDYIGELGGTGGDWGEHIHINLQVPGFGLSGYVVPDVVDPEPYIDMEPVSHLDKIDLYEFLAGDGRAYMVQHNNGPSEKFRTEFGEGGLFYQVKNSQWDELRVGDKYIYRGLDTSPGPAPSYSERPGAPRFYRQYNAGGDIARWCYRYMAVGEQYIGSGHMVQFYYKSDCALSNANSGGAINNITLTAHIKDWTSPYGINVGEVIVLESTNGEQYIYGKSYGLVGWRSPDGLTKSYVSEVDVQPDNEMEAIPCL